MHIINYQIRIEGRGVEKDEKRAVYYLEEASIGGHHIARYTLAALEVVPLRTERALKHYLIIAANIGCNLSIEALREVYAEGYVSKDDFASALHAYQAAVDATKCPMRDAVERALPKVLCRN